MILQGTMNEKKESYGIGNDPVELIKAGVETMVYKLLKKTCNEMCIFIHT